MRKCLVRPSVRRSAVLSRGVTPGPPLPPPTFPSPSTAGRPALASGISAESLASTMGSVLRVQEAADQRAVHVVQLRGLFPAAGHDLRAARGELAALRGPGQVRRAA